MNPAEVEMKEEQLKDTYPSKRHLETGKSIIRQYKNQNINLGTHLARLRIEKRKGRNDNPNTKFKKPKEAEFRKE